MFSSMQYMLDLYGLLTITAHVNLTHPEINLRSNKENHKISKVQRELEWFITNLSSPY
jgi:hypothetical protein